MNSMTGFGRATTLAEGRRFVVEIRSVNHRGVDVKVRARDIDASCEVEIIRAVRDAIERGAVVVSLREDGTSAAGFDPRPVRTVHRALELLREELGIPGRVDLATVAAFLSEAAGISAPGGTDWDTLRPAVREALEGLNQMRRQEGAALAADLVLRLQRLRDSVKAIGVACAQLPTRAARRLEERLAALVGPETVMDPSRLAQEVAVLAERLDVSEELVRLETHLAHLERMLEATGPGGSGRKIDFLVQEIGRELNTVGAKVQDAQVAALVIDGKAELEKIREQAQNIE